MSESTVGGAGRRMKYPYSILGKFVHFPWKHYWKHGRGFRFIIYALPISLLVVSPINKFGEFRRRRGSCPRKSEGRERGGNCGSAM